MQPAQRMGSLSKLPPVFYLKAGENKCKITTEHPGMQAQPGMCEPAAKGKDSNNVKHERNLQSPSAVQEGLAKTGAAVVSRQ